MKEGFDAARVAFLFHFGQKARLMGQFGNSMIIMPIRPRISLRQAYMKGGGGGSGSL